MNNFEKIKSMSVDEMAEYICGLFSCCDSCQFLYECGNETEKHINPYKQWLLAESEDKLCL